MNKALPSARGFFHLALGLAFLVFSRAVIFFDGGLEILDALAQAFAQSCQLRSAE